MSTSKTRFVLTRRAVLRGVGGAAVGLPALEIMTPPPGASAAGAVPRRYVACYGGISIGAAFNPNGPYTVSVPTRTGKDWEVTRGFKPVEDLKMKPDIGIVSGLKIPWGPVGNVPPGGRNIGFHFSTKAPQCSGLRCSNRDTGDGEGPRGPSSDQLAADVIAKDVPQRVLSYRVQVSTYEFGSNPTGGSNGRFSFDKGGRAVDPVFSPRLAYESLFGGGSATNGDFGSIFAATLARRRSILDVVRENTQRLLPRLGTADKQRISQHFDEIRSLENRIDALQKAGATQNPACKQPSAVSDPPIGGAGLCKDAAGENVICDGDNAGWSNETLRADLLFDATALAFACDLARVASVLISQSQSVILMNHINGQTVDLHGTSHFNPGGSIENMADALAWHVRSFARFASKLKAITDADGTTVLDNTAMVLFFEGGYGCDPEGFPEEGGSSCIGHPHSSENMIVVFAGRAGGLKAGEHFHFNNDRHPAQVVLTAMNAVGVRGPLGEITQPLPELGVV